MARIQVQRRTWDAEEYQKRADEKREEAERLEREVCQYFSQYSTSPSKIYLPLFHLPLAVTRSVLPRLYLLSHFFSCIKSLVVPYSGWMRAAEGGRRAEQTQK